MSVITKYQSGTGKSEVSWMWGALVIVLLGIALYVVTKSMPFTSTPVDSNKAPAVATPVKK